MRVLFLIHSLRRGGAEKILLELAKGFKNADDEVAVISWVDEDRYADVSYDEIPRYSIIKSSQYSWVWSILSSSRILKQKIEDFKPDVIQIHSPNVTWLAAFCKIRVPTIQVLHGYGYITFDGSLRSFLKRIIFRYCARALQLSFITVSKSMIPISASYYKLKSEKFKLVVNGVDTNNFSFKYRSSNSDPVIIMVGTLCKLKGQVLGVEAFKKLLNFLPNAKLLIVGDGEDKSLLEKLINFHQLSNSIEILGNRDDIPNLLSSANLFWHLSESEAMPLSVLEAMSSGLCVVGFDVRGTRDAVCDGETGYLTAYGNIDGIVEITTDVFKNPNKLKMLERNSRKRIEKFFLIETMIKSHRAICSALVEEKSKINKR